ncbi:hypothetical protein HMPREF1508_1498 [Shuttleworthella sp. MSX8B]|nr:hypothetical protein HMPREF1508_1498 [Shuttleworthia sp. MSX8B]
MPLAGSGPRVHRIAMNMRADSILCLRVLMYAQNVRSALLL